MQIHELKVIKKKDRKRVGRGGKRGTYSGRGIKGQMSRSGAKKDPLFEGGRSSLIDRLKKTRGFKSIHAKKSVINLDQLEDKFEEGEIVNYDTLVEKGLLKNRDIVNGVKILGRGELKKKLKIADEILISASAGKLFGRKFEAKKKDSKEDRKKEGKLGKKVKEIN